MITEGAAGMTFNLLTFRFDQIHRIDKGWTNGLSAADGKAKITQ